MTTRFADVGVEKVERALCGLFDVLEDLGAEPFLVGGALLGAARGGALLPHDKDIDIGLLDESALYRLGRELSLRSYPTSDIPLGPRGGKILWSQLPVDGVALPVEIQAHYTSADRAYRNCAMGPSWSKYWAGNISWPKGCFETFGEVEIAGRTFRTPGHLPVFLSTFYGEDWAVEKVYCDWRYNAANLREGFVDASPVIAIAGATKGVGRFSALRFLEKGWSVSGFGRTAPEERSGRYLSTAGDVTDAEAVGRWIERTRETFGYIDAVFYAAGTVRFAAVEESSSDMAREMFESEVVGLMTVTKAVLPTFRRQSEGHIILLSSSRALSAAPRKAVYSAVKHASRAFLESVSKETSVSSTILAPGAIYTARAPELYGDEMAKAVRIPMSDVAVAVEYILATSPSARPPLLRIGGVL